MPPRVHLAPDPTQVSEPLPPAYSWAPDFEAVRLAICGKFANSKHLAVLSELSRMKLDSQGALLRAVHHIANVYLKRYPRSSWWHSSQDACAALLAISRLSSDILIILKQLGGSSTLAQTLLLAIAVYYEGLPECSCIAALQKTNSFRAQVAIFATVLPAADSLATQRRADIGYNMVFIRSAGLQLINQSNLAFLRIQTAAELLAAFRHIAMTALNLNTQQPYYTSFFTMSYDVSTCLRILAIDDAIADSDVGSLHKVGEILDSMDACGAMTEVFAFAMAKLMKHVDAQLFYNVVAMHPEDLGMNTSITPAYRRWRRVRCCYQQLLLLLTRREQGADASDAPPFYSAGSGEEGGLLPQRGLGCYTNRH